MVKEKYVTKFKGWKIVKITSGKAKGMFYAKKGDTSFGILGDNSVPSIKADINRREGSTTNLTAGVYTKKKKLREMA